jgi:hypothetical protein
LRASYWRWWLGATSPQNRDVPRHDERSGLVPLTKFRARDQTPTTLFLGENIICKFSHQEIKLQQHSSSVKTSIANFLIKKACQSGLVVFQGLYASLTQGGKVSHIIYYWTPESYAIRIGATLRFD